MPTFYGEDFDIDPDDFISACDSDEIKELIDVLVEGGYVKKHDVEPNDKNLFDEEWDEIMDKLSGRGRLRLTNEEEETIRKIANRL